MPNFSTQLQNDHKVKLHDSNTKMAANPAETTFLGDHLSYHHLVKMNFILPPLNEAFQITSLQHEL